MAVKTNSKRFIAVTAATLTMAALSNGIAQADPLAGMTYADAASRVSEWGSTAIISTVVGGALSTDECIVTSSRKSTSVSGDNFDHKNGYLLALNCNANVATAAAPGNSAASPEGRKAKALAAKADWLNGKDGAVWCEQNTNDCANFCTSSGLCSDDTKAIAG